MILKYNAVQMSMDCPICGFSTDKNVNTCERCGTKFPFLSAEKDNFQKATEMIKEQSNKKGKD